MNHICYQIFLTTENLPNLNQNITKIFEEDQTKLIISPENLHNLFQKIQICNEIFSNTREAD